MKINEDFIAKALIYLYKLEKKSNSYYFYPALTGLTKAGENINLGFSCFGLKSFFILNEWKNLKLEEQNKWINSINNFQNLNIDSITPNSYIDLNYYKYITKFNPKKEISRNVKKILKKNYKNKKIEIDEYFRAETKQAISTLYQVGAKNELPYHSPILKPNLINKYLNSLNWENPWSAGAQFSGLCVFLKTQEFDNQNFNNIKNDLINFSNKIVNPDNGCYFNGNVSSKSELINGAMKMLSGFDWLDIRVHYPEKLIDTALNTRPSSYGCDLVDIVYILFMCTKETKYKRNEIVLYFNELLNMIEKHYFKNVGGFSYYLNKSQKFYYGLIITRGKNTPDLHGTTLLLWALSMIYEVLEPENNLLNIIKP